MPRRSILGVRHLNDPLRIVVLCALAILPLVPVGVRAQQEEMPPAALVIVTGRATIERDTLEAAAAVENMPIVPGDRLRTADGRIEVLFPDGTALDIDEQSTVDVLALTVIRVSTGRVILVVPAGATESSYELQTLLSATRIDRPGAYRTEATDRTVQSANGVVLDAFGRWSLANSQARESAASAQYLPADLQPYGAALDQSGTWDYVPAYGYVWYPRVSAGWRPYSSGYWSAVRPYGWTWIGADRWSWPTHHYGRWEHARGS